MKKFFSDLYYSFFYSYSRRKSVYIISVISIIIGVIIGIILSFTHDDLDFTLSLSNKNYTDYLNGTAELSIIFLENFKWVVVGNIICILLSFSTVTFLLGLCYICYQSVLLVMTTVCIIKTFRFAGVVNSLLFILPFNLFIIICLCLILSSLFAFFINNKKNKSSLFELREDKFVFLRVGIIFLSEVIICLILSYIVPLALKSFVIVSF